MLLPLEFSVGDHVQLALAPHIHLYQAPAVELLRNLDRCIDVGRNQLADVADDSSFSTSAVQADFAPSRFALSRATNGQKNTWQRPTLPPTNGVVPSALEGLTSVFGMGTGGTPPP